MVIIGLTGGSGAGKGYVSRLFAKRGIISIDTDAVSREVCAPGEVCLDELVCRFGTSILCPDGSLDRRALASLAFSDDLLLCDLNRITHRHILARCREFIALRSAAGDFACIIDAPLLFESGFDAECDVIVSVVAEDETRIKRIMKRDGISEDVARRRLSKQKSNSEYIEKSDYIVYNNDTEDLEEQVEAICRDIAGKRHGGGETE